MKLLNSLVSGAIGELRQINWPTRKETIRLVITVIGFSVGMALLLWAADLFFLQLVDKFIIKI